MSKPMEDDPDAPASPEELAAAARLRDALDDPRAERRDDADDDAALARAAAAAYAPREIDAAEHRAIVERALLAGPAAKAGARSGTVIRVAFGVAAALSMAAAALLLMRTSQMEPAQAWTTPLAPARSTQPLFDAPFAGSSSARIDRIARARASDLRDNRFAMRGVR